MNKLPERQVLVTLRAGIDIEKISIQKNIMANICGAVGKMIADDVISQGGQASVPIGWIKMATDTSDGVNIIFDNFELTDSRTQRPLIFSLI